MKTAGALAAAIAALWAAGAPAEPSKPDDPDARARALEAQLTPEERIVILHGVMATQRGPDFPKEAIGAAGYVPGIYVGADCILNGQALRFRLKFAHYWKSLSDVPDIPGRGYQMIQSAGQPVADVDTDLDRTQTDLLGDKVVWLAPPTVIRT